MHKILFFVILLMIQFPTFAQDKPLKKHSKKELIAMVEAQQTKIDALTLQLSSNREALEKSLAAGASTKAQLASTIQDLKKSKEQNKNQQEKYDSLNQAHSKLKNEPPKEIEVLDLYSFGYQPYQYNNGVYNKLLNAAREEVIKARMENIYDLVKVLQSHKVKDESKNSLYYGFKRAYKGYFDRVTKDQLTYFNAKLDEELKKGVRQRTYRELDIISKENRWIQMLEFY